MDITVQSPADRAPIWDHFLRKDTTVSLAFGTGGGLRQVLPGVTTTATINGSSAFEICSQWIETPPTDQVVSTEVEYDPRTGRQLQR